MTLAPLGHRARAELHYVATALRVPSLAKVQAHVPIVQRAHTARWGLALVVSVYQEQEVARNLGLAYHVQMVRTRASEPNFVSLVRLVERAKQELRVAICARTGREVPQAQVVANLVQQALTQHVQMHFARVVRLGHIVT